MNPRAFASDNNAGVHPEVLAAIAEANTGHVPSYGDDAYTARAEAAFRTLLGPETETFFTFNGTGANVVALAAALRPYQAVICVEGAHLNVDECGAYERFAGGKIVDVPAREGKLDPADAERAVRGAGDQHHVQPGAISISQSTETGTVYSLEEIRALGSLARKHGLLFHVDGARIANAVASLGCDAADMLAGTGVDVVTFGGTKNGALCGEAIVFPRPHPAVAALPFTRKGAMQLASKMRFVAVQFDALLRDGLWLRNATHANAMAARLAERIAGLPGVELGYRVEANGVFPVLPRAVIPGLQAKRRFYVWDEAASIVRWMTSWDTEAADVDAFADDVRQEVTALTLR